MGGCARRRALRPVTPPPSRRAGISDTFGESNAVGSAAVRGTGSVGILPSTGGGEGDGSLALAGALLLIAAVLRRQRSRLNVG